MGEAATDRKQERGQQDPFLMVAGPGFEPQVVQSMNFEKPVSLRKYSRELQRKIA